MLTRIGQDGKMNGLVDVLDKRAQSSQSNRDRFSMAGRLRGVAERIFKWAPAPCERTNDDWPRFRPTVQPGKTSAAPRSVARSLRACIIKAPHELLMASFFFST